MANTAEQFNLSSKKIF